MQDKLFTLCSVAALPTRLLLPPSSKQVAQEVLFNEDEAKNEA